MDTALNFLETLWGEDDLPGSIVIWVSDTKRSQWFDSIGAAAAAAEKLSREGNVFVGMALQDWELAQQRKLGATKSNTRGSEHSVRAIPGFWMDIDVAGDGHKEEALPPTTEEAVGLARSLALPPTMIVHTGGGIHAHWLFREPWELEEEDERALAKQMLTRLQYTIQEAARAKGWELDSTYDLARVLRPSGTYNRKKDTPRPVKILELHDHMRYLPEDFDGILLEVNQVRAMAPRVDPATVLAGIPEGDRDNALYKYACSLRARRIPIEEAQILVFQAADNCTPRFPRELAIEKLRSAWTHPEGTDREVRKQEAVTQVKSIEEWDPENIFTHETIGNLAVIRETDETEYQRIKNKLRGKVSVRDLDKAVKAAMDDRKKARRSVRAESARTPLDELLVGVPVTGLRKPAAWNINENGVHMASEEGIIRACGVPVIITRVYNNLDTGEEKIGLAWLHNGKWKEKIVDGTVAFGNPNIVQLRKYGLPVSSPSAKDLIKYLMDFEYENREILPRSKSVSHLGWVDEKTFIPGLAGDIDLDLEHGLDIMASHYREQGKLEDWVQLVEPLREHTMGRFVLAAGFASPLLTLLGQRVFLLHAWGSSTAGKSASMKAALSVWGDANETITNFSSTRVALERMASMRGDLPLGIDERQVAGDRQHYIDELIYLLSGGKGKERGTKTGGTATSTSWRCIVLTNGEQPLTNDNSAAGLKSRTLEITGHFVPDLDLADKLHTDTSVYFGTAGPAVIRAIVKKQEEEPGWIEAKFEEFRDAFKEDYPETSTVHQGFVATVCLGDYLSSLYVFDLDEEEAMQQALAMGHVIMSEADTRDSMADTYRSYDFFLGWMGTKMQHFSEDPPQGERYGVVEGNWVYIFPHILKKALEDGGFNKSKALNDWAAANIAKVQVEPGRKARTDVRVKNKGDWQTSSRLNVIKLNYYEELEAAQEMEQLQLLGQDEEQF